MPQLPQFSHQLIVRMKINRQSTLFKIVSLAVVICIFGVIAKIFIANWTKIPFSQLRINYVYLSAGLLMMVPLPLIAVALWQCILRLLGEKPSFLHLWRIAAYSTIARYLPGRIWQYMGRLYWGKKIGLADRNILLSSILEMVFYLCSAFFLSFYSLKLYLSAGYVYILAGTTIATLIFLHPRILERVINIAGKKYLKSPMSLTFSYWQILLLIISYTLLWLLIGVQYFFFLNSFYSLSPSEYISLASINAASWLVGAVSMISPSGIGIKEGVFVFIFKQIIPVSIAIIFALFIRFAGIIWDFLCACIFFAFDRSAWRNFLDFRKRPKPDDQITA